MQIRFGRTIVSGLWTMIEDTPSEAMNSVKSNICIKFVPTPVLFILVGTISLVFQRVYGAPHLNCEN